MKGAEDRGDRRGARRDMRRRLGTKAMGKRREVQERRREIRGIHPRLPFSYVLGPGGVTISNSIALTPPGLSLADSAGILTEEEAKAAIVHPSTFAMLPAEVFPSPPRCRRVIRAVWISALLLRMVTPPGSKAVHERAESRG